MQDRFSVKHAKACKYHGHFDNWLSTTTQRVPRSKLEVFEVQKGDGNQPEVGSAIKFDLHNIAWLGCLWLRVDRQPVCGIFDYFFLGDKHLVYSHNRNLRRYLVDHCCLINVVKDFIVDLKEVNFKL